jgi:hypothetical protein
MRDLSKHFRLLAVLIIMACATTTNAQIIGIKSDIFKKQKDCEFCLKVFSFKKQLGKVDDLISRHKTIKPKKRNRLEQRILESASLFLDNAEIESRGLVAALDGKDRVKYLTPTISLKLKLAELKKLLCDYQNVNGRQDMDVLLSRITTIEGTLPNL